MTGDAERGRARWVYIGDTEPDPRFSLANERTFLAWIRTSLALIASGVAVVALGIPGLAHWRLPIGCVLVGLGVIAAVSGLLRWARTERAMRSGSVLPRLRGSLLLVAGVAVVGVVVGIALFW